MFNKKEAIYLYIVNCLFYLIPLTGFSHFIHHKTNKK